MTFGPAATRAIVLHGINSVAVFAATVMWTAKGGVDLFAIVDQLNDTLVEVAKFGTAGAPIAVAFMQWWKSRPRGLVADVNELAKDKIIPVKGVITTDTPEGHALARSIHGPVETAGTDQAIDLAKS